MEPGGAHTMIINIYNRKNNAQPERAPMGTKAYSDAQEEQSQEALTDLRVNIF